MTSIERATIERAPRGVSRRVRGRARYGRRAGERGAAIFVVVLVITMLTAIGVYAARSASLSTSASGHARQMTQTHYLTEYGMGLALSALAVDLVPTVKRMQEQPDSTCYAMTNAVGARCLRLLPPSLEARLAPGGKLIATPTATTPGSLGRTSLDPAFSIELTDGTFTSPAQGYDRSPTSTAPFRFYSITVTGTGQIRPAGATSWSSTESARAHITVGPLL